MSSWSKQFLFSDPFSILIGLRELSGLENTELWARPCRPWWKTDSTSRLCGLFAYCGLCDWSLAFPVSVSHSLVALWPRLIIIDFLRPGHLCMLWPSMYHVSTMSEWVFHFQLFAMSDWLAMANRWANETRRSTSWRLVNTETCVFSWKMTSFSSVFPTFYYPQTFTVPGCIRQSKDEAPPPPPPRRGWVEDDAVTPPRSNRVWWKVAPCRLLLSTHLFSQNAFIRLFFLVGIKKKAEGEKQNRNWTFFPFSVCHV